MPDWCRPWNGSAAAVAAEAEEVRPTARPPTTPPASAAPPTAPKPEQATPRQAGLRLTGHEAVTTKLVLSFVAPGQ